MRPPTTMDAIDDYLEALLDDGPAAKAELAAAHAPPGGGTVVPPAAPSPRPAATDAAPQGAPVPAAAPVAGPSRQATAAIPSAAAAPQVQAPRWVRVTVGADSYALELLCVQEVVRVTPVVAMRGADRAVLGVMNLRGRIVPVFDLGLWLGLACVQADDRSRIVVVERDDELIGVLVTTVEDVVTLGRDRIEPPLPGSDPGAILGIARVGATPTVLLDANALYG